MKLFAILVLFLEVDSFAQSVVPPQVRATNFIDGAASGIRIGEMIFGMPLAPAARVGHYYMAEHWNPAAILFYQDQKLVTGYVVKFNLQDQVVEVKLPGTIVGISVEKIKSLSWKDSASSTKKVFINCQEYNIDRTPCSGLTEVIVDGKWALLKKMSIFIKRANYVPALDIGKNVDEIQKKENFFFLDGSQLIPIKKKGTLFKDFKSRNISLGPFQESNDLDVHDENDLIQLFKYLNEP